MPRTYKKNPKVELDRFECFWIRDMAKLAESSLTEAARKKSEALGIKNIGLLDKINIQAYTDLAAKMDSAIKQRGWE